MAQNYLAITRGGGARYGRATMGNDMGNDMGNVRGLDCP